MLSIRRYQEADWPAVWPMLHATFAAGETYAYAPQTSAAQAHHSWVEAPAATYVACADDGRGGLIHLTPEGEEYFRETALVHRDIIRDLALNDLDDEEIEVLDRVFSRIANRIDDSCGTAAAKRQVQRWPDQRPASRIAGAISNTPVASVSHHEVNIDGEG